MTALVTPAEECRIAAATLRDPDSVPDSPSWLYYLPPHRVRESLAAILEAEADLAVDPKNHAEPMPAALAFARAVNWSTPADVEEGAGEDDESHPDPGAIDRAIQSERGR